MRDMHLLYIIYAGGRGAHDCMCCSSQVLYFNLCCNNEMIYSDIMYRMVRLPCYYHIVGRYKSARGHLWSVALLCVAITPYHPAAASSCYRRNNASSICVFLRLRGRLWIRQRIGWLPGRSVLYVGEATTTSQWLPPRSRPRPRATTHQLEPWSRAEKKREVPVPVRRPSVAGAS
jgi:hypothetical protein